jgi:hypothetical protein
MARKRKVKLKISTELLSKLEPVHEELINRGAEGIDLCQLLERLFDEPNAQSVVDHFVNDHTPNDYKIARLLETPEERERLLKIIENKQFGLGQFEAHAN